MSTAPARPLALGSAVLVGALFGGLGMVAAGWALRLLGLAAPSEAFREFLTRGGWLWIPLWGAATGALVHAVATRSPASRRAASLIVAVLFALAPLLLRPVVPDAVERVESPKSRAAKGTAIRRWAYRDPGAVARILPYSADPDPIVREQAVLALGVNLIVTDTEHATTTRPARFLAHPLRARLRDALLVVSRDPIEAVRAEAARGLWNAPRTFGPQPAAAETLAAILDRTAARGDAPRAAWLALDAAAGPPDEALKAAAARFAVATPDTALRRAALRASAR